jgi:streptomycin 6-kinase
VTGSATRLPAIPPSLEWWRQKPGGSEWLARLPRLAAECARLWSLDVGEPFAGGNVALVLPARRADGSSAVLKVSFPDVESRDEGEALAFWAGHGAVRLLARDGERHALLLERCVPGSRLWEVVDDEEAIRIGVAVLRRLHRPAPTDHPFRVLQEEADRWAIEIAEEWERLGRPYERELVDAATTAIRELAPTQPVFVVCHQDFHGGNVLRAQREHWLAIDPKPLVGEPAFDAASLLRDRRWLLCELGAARRMRRRLELVAEELDVDRERMRGWGIVHALAWGVSGTKLEPEMVECARLLLAA